MPFFLAHLRMAGIYFLLCGSDQRIQKIVGLYAKTLAPRDFYIGALLVFFRYVIAQFHGATWRERHHFIRKMMVVLCLFRVAKSTNRFNHIVLWIGLARDDDVINCIHAAKVRMVFFARLGRNPHLAAIGITIKTLIAEVA